MEAINGSSSENAGEDHRMLEAAEALAALSHVGESVSERVKAVSNAGNSCFDSIESSSKRPINVDKVSYLPNFHRWPCNYGVLITISVLNCYFVFTITFTNHIVHFTYCFFISMVNFDNLYSN